MYLYNCLNNISDVGLDLFSHDYKETDASDDADVILVRSAKMHEMEFSDKLVAIARAGAGTNNIPLEKCAEKGIVVFNTPGANANAVKELVLTGMLLASRDIIGGNKWVSENKDNADIAKDMEKAKKSFAGTEIAGKKLGVIGLGAIGIRVANAALALGMDVYGYDPYLSIGAAWDLSRDVHHISSVDDIYRQCDFITVHVPLLDSTKEMINKDAISKMKDGVVILNFARDLLVDEKAVLEGINSGKIKRYVSDFPNPVTAGQKGVILTPHLGASTEEAEDNCAVMAVKEMRDFLENGNIANSVNYPACSLGPVRRAGRVAICHKNVANMIGQFTSILGNAGVNIDSIANKSRGDFAYTLIDTDSAIPAEVVAALQKSDAVIRVRVIK
jgi:D-3-phosphoglycerate dehydrogenase